MLQAIQVVQIDTTADGLPVLVDEHAARAELG